MHSYHHPSGINVHHNGDNSGNAKITIPASIIDKRRLSEIVYLDEDGNLWIDLIPARVIADFSYDATINHVISILEQLEPPRN